MRSRILAAVFFAAFSASAHAQTTSTNPVTENYRAYQAALARNDLAAAEMSAMAALAASEARDGDGGRTAVLALNLAMVRLDRGNSPGAKAMAERAHNLATSRENTGVDPLLAQLVLGQAELNVGGGVAGRDRLAAALSRAENRADLSERRLLAGNELGHWALSKGDHTWARMGFGFAARSVTGRDPLSSYVRARAQIAEAASIIQGDQQTRQRDPAGAIETLRILGSVKNTLYPFLQQMNSNLAVTPTQQAYAEALAWEGVTKIAYPDLEPPPMTVETNECEVKFDRREMTHYFPMLANWRRMDGVVVVRILFDQAGAMQRGEVVVAAPEAFFPQNARQMVNDYNVRIDMNSRPGCEPQRVTFFPVTFTSVVNPQPDEIPNNRRHRRQ